MDLFALAFVAYNGWFTHELLTPDVIRGMMIGGTVIAFIFAGPIKWLGVAIFAFAFALAMGWIQMTFEGFRLDPYYLMLTGYLLIFFNAR